MGNPQATVWQEITQGIGKFLMWMAYILIGVVAKLAFDSKSHKLSRKELVIKFFLSTTVGVVTALSCNALGAVKTGIILVPVMTLIGESLIGYIVANWQALLSKVAPGWISKEDNTKKTTP